MLNVKIDTIKLIGASHSAPLLQNLEFEMGVNSIYTIIGENGEGKTTFIKSLTGLLDERFAQIEGKVLFDGMNLLKTDYESILKLRQNKIRYVFQDAINCFNPLKTLKYYFDKTGVNQKVIDSMLNYFLLPDFNKLSKLYSYEISGGMAQRINIALAMLAKPQLLIFDEPTSSLDIPMANITAEKIKEFVNEYTSSVLIITQDLNFAFEVSDKIAYLGNGTLSRFFSIHDFTEKGKDYDFKKIKLKIDELMS